MHIFASSRLQWLRVATVAGGPTLKVTFYYSENASKSRPKTALAFLCYINTLTRSLLLPGEKLVRSNSFITGIIPISYKTLRYPLYLVSRGKHRPIIIT